MFSEVEGRYQAYRPSSELATPRIDRILFPSEELRQLGWNLGPIGVEIKKSDMKLGRPLGQLVSYTRAAFLVKDMWVVPEWFFLWPMTRQFGPMQSILASLRCGGVYPRDGKLTFHSASVLAEVDSASARCRPYNAEHGRKVGSR